MHRLRRTHAIRRRSVDCGACAPLELGGAAERRDVSAGRRPYRWPPPPDIVRQRADQRFYIARREWPAIYVLLPDDVEQLQTGSGDRLTWGPARDPLALARAMALDLCQVRAPEGVVTSLARESVSRLPAAGFVIEGYELLRWVLPRG
jgi:hypothetical protein